MHRVRAYIFDFCSFFNCRLYNILNCYFVTVDHPRSLLHGPNIALKFHVNRITYVRDMGTLNVRVMETVCNGIRV